MFRKDKKSYIYINEVASKYFLFGLGAIMSLNYSQAGIYQTIMAFLTMAAFLGLVASALMPESVDDRKRSILYIVYYSFLFAWYLGIMIDFFVTYKWSPTHLVCIYFYSYLIKLTFIIIISLSKYHPSFVTLKFNNPIFFIPYFFSLLSGISLLSNFCTLFRTSEGHFYPSLNSRRSFCPTLKYSLESTGRWLIFYSYDQYSFERKRSIGSYLG